MELTVQCADQAGSGCLFVSGIEQRPLECGFDVSDKGARWGWSPKELTGQRCGTGFDLLESGECQPEVGFRGRDSGER